MGTSHRPNPKRKVKSPEPVKQPICRRPAGKRISRRAFVLERELHVSQVDITITLWRLHMRYLLMLLCFFCATSVAYAKPMPKYRSQTTTLNVFDPLPASVLTLPMKDYTRWAKSHNKLAYEKAEYRARQFNKRHPRPSITVITTEYIGTPLIDYYGGSTRTTIRRGMIRQTQQTYRQPPWGGGPVVIINPYCRPTGN